MADIDVDRLLAIVTGVQLKAELGDRPLAYRIEAEVRKRLADLLPKSAENEPPLLAPVVVSDVYYLNHEEMQSRPTIAVGGPGMNMLAANWAEELPAALAIENVLVIQMDLDFKDLRCAVWGMDHLATVRAVETFLVKGYLDAFVRGAVDAAQADE